MEMSRRHFLLALATVPTVPAAYLAPAPTVRFIEAPLDFGFKRGVACFIEGQNGYVAKAAASCELADWPRMREELRRLSMDHAWSIYKRQNA